ncbi:hypothetical protein EI94DRAFT_1702909 [Lactarius quietus]|nr:hypothetical protein EI94DRAFT_1702909 [Lactarius quietus]
MEDGQDHWLVYDSHQLKLKKKAIKSVNIELHACVHMTSEPLEVLKKGLAPLKRHISAKKDHLTTLKNGQPISEEDETWVDQGAGNMVDEDWVLDVVENASDYKHGLQLLSPEDRLIVENLQKLANEASEVVGSKQAFLNLEAAEGVSAKRRRPQRSGTQSDI